MALTSFRVALGHIWHSLCLGHSFPNTITAWFLFLPQVSSQMWPRDNPSQNPSPACALPPLHCLGFLHGTIMGMLYVLVCSVSQQRNINFGVIGTCVYFVKLYSGYLQQWGASISIQQILINEWPKSNYHIKNIKLFLINWVSKTKLGPFGILLISWLSLG